MKTLEVLEKVLKGKRIKPNTVDNYGRALNSLARYSEEWPVSGLIINEWIASMKNYSDSTVEMYWHMGKSAGRYIKKAYKIDNPFDETDRPKIKKKQRRHFEPQELLTIVGSCKKSYDRELILTLIDGTMRISELSGRKGKDVIMPVTGKDRGWLNVEDAKTGDRKYSLDGRICQALKELAGNDDHIIFEDANGNPASPDTLKHRVRNINIRAGMTGKKLGAHTIRHSGGTLIARKTLSPLAVKAVLQQDDIESAMNYIHDVEDEIQQEMSPLRIVEEYAVEKTDGEIRFKQLTMGNSQSDESSENNNMVPVVEPENTMNDDMFPEIQDDTNIRPLLKTDDLKLMRIAFILLANKGYHREMLEARLLMKRMLRKAEVH